MHLDRLLDGVDLGIAPVAVCDVRRGVRVELSAADELLLHYIVRGTGTLSAGHGFVAALGPCTLAIVPVGVAHSIEPEGGSSRRVSIDPIGTSDHVPMLCAGSGERGLSFVSGRARSIGHGVDPFAGLLAPLVVELANVAAAEPLFAALLEEQELRLPGGRRMTELLMQQCLVHSLRKLCDTQQHALPWLWALQSTREARSAETTAVGRKAPRPAQ